MNKKILIILAIILGGLVFVFVLLSHPSEDSTIPPGTKIEKNVRDVSQNLAFGRIAPVALENISETKIESIPLQLKLDKSQIEALPTTVPVYAYTDEKIVTKALGQAVSDNLQISNIPTRLNEGTLSWLKENNDHALQLTVNEETRVLDYQKIPPNYNGVAPTRDEAYNAAFKFVTDNNLLFPDLLIDKNLIKPVYVGPELFSYSGLFDYEQDKDGPSFNAMVVPIVRDVMGDVINDSYVGHQRYILVGAGGEIWRVYFNYRPINLLTESGYNLYSINPDSLNLQDNGILFINGNIMSRENLASYTLDKVRVVYMELTQEADYIQPVYLFEGNGILTNGKIVEVKYALPAVSGSSN